METKLPVIIANIHLENIDAVSKIHAQQFSRQNDSLKWISCNFTAYPRIMIFVARDEKDKVVGYIQWIQKSRFRQQTILELEQIAVLESHQNNGIGSFLINKSLELIKIYLDDTRSVLKAILILTRTDNKAKALYKKTLKAEEVAIIKNLYSHDEVILLARDV